MPPLPHTGKPLDPEGLPGHLEDEDLVKETQPEDESRVTEDMATLALHPGMLDTVRTGSPADRATGPAADVLTPEQRQARAAAAARGGLFAISGGGVLVE